MMKSKTKTTFTVMAALIPAVMLGAQLLAQDDDPKAQTPSSSESVPLSKVEWGALNPARGAAGPRAGNLWGDRTGKGTTGFLVKFADGFSSPPHIHNVTYRGVVISGLVHNDDPEAAEMWMPPGSYWTQPAGEVHITAARGENVMAYIEIESGPYRVMPADEASDNGERPVNIDASNIVWLDASNCTWIGHASNPASPEAAKIAFLWENSRGDRGTLVKLPAGFTGRIESGSSFRAIVIEATPELRVEGEADGNTIQPGDYFGSEEGGKVFQLSNETGMDCIIYVRTGGKFEIVPAPTDK